MSIDRRDVVNERGCRDIMYSWYRAGFIENIIMSIIGLAIGAFQFYLYSLNRREYFKVLDDYDDLRKPMMNTTMSMSTINSKGSAGLGHGHLINFGPQPSRFASQQRLISQNTPSMGGDSMVMTSTTPQLPQMTEPNNYSNPLQSVQNANVKFPFRGRNFNNNTPSDRIMITEPN